MDVWGHAADKATLALRMRESPTRYNLLAAQIATSVAFAGTSHVPWLVSEGHGPGPPRALAEVKHGHAVLSPL